MRALLVVAPLLLASCTPSFASPSEVTDLRILAVAAEPPEAFADLDAGTVTPVTVRLLVADPFQRQTPRITSASICFPTDNKLCDAGPSLQLATPDAGTYELSFSAPAALVVAALQDDRLKGLGGVRVQLDAVVDDGDPHGPVTGEKVLLYSTVPPEQANHSPQIALVEVKRGDGTTEPLAEGGTLQLRINEQVGLRPIHGDGGAGPETYTATDLSNQLVTLTEQLNYSFYGPLGVSWDQDRADEPLPGAPTPPFGIARLTGQAAGLWPFWMVVRDGRGGVSWLSASANVR